jgi:hypothetical protein
MLASDLRSIFTANSIVMPRLGLGIHEFGVRGKKLVDPKAKPWDDEREWGDLGAPHGSVACR